MPGQLALDDLPPLPCRLARRPMPDGPELLRKRIATSPPTIARSGSLLVRRSTRTVFGLTAGKITGTAIEDRHVGVCSATPQSWPLRGKL
jgi:hypothetical protein